MRSAGTLEKVDLDADLTFYSPDGVDRPVSLRALALGTLAGELIELRLTIALSAEAYHAVSQEALFGLQPDMRRPAGAELPPECPAEVDLSLKAALLTRLAGYPVAADAAALLLDWARVAPQDAVFASENWLATSVRTTGDCPEAGYTTIWGELAPSHLAGGLASGQFDELFSAISDLLSLAVSAPTESEPESGQPPVPPALLPQVRTHLNSQGWPFLPLDDGATLLLTYQGQNGSYSCYLRVREVARQLSFYTICPVTIPEHMRPAVAELVARANFGLILGNFEFNMDDGAVRYKTSLDVGEQLLTGEQFSRLSATSLQAMDRYLPAILQLFAGVADPVAALASIEN